MATELLPLLSGGADPPPPDDSFNPTTALTIQDLADQIDAYLGNGNPDGYPYSYSKMGFDYASAIWTLLSSPDSTITLTNGLLEAMAAGFGQPVSDWLAVTQAVLGVFWGTNDPTTAAPLRTVVDGIAASVDAPSLWSGVQFDPADPRWTLVVGSAFTTALHLTALAHVYTVAFNPGYGYRSDEVIDGETVTFGAAWWCEMAGTFRGERHYMDFANNLCHREGRLMRGIFVNLPKGGSGTVNAYRWTP